MPDDRAQPDLFGNPAVKPKRRKAKREDPLAAPRRRCSHCGHFGWKDEMVEYRGPATRYVCEKCRAAGHRPDAYCPSCRRLYRKGGSGGLG